MNKPLEVLYKWAYILALVTVFYNIIEGGVSVGFGMKDETISLFGFGLDSFVEVISGVGILHMTRQLKWCNGEEKDSFEQRALRITGTAFYILAFGLIVTAAINIYTGHKPETTYWGVVIALISIFSMWALIYFKVKIGKKLQSQAILADAHCTRACMYLSVILLAASVCYEISGLGWIDSMGAIILACLSLKEGRESFQKAKGIGCSCH